METVYAEQALKISNRSFEASVKFLKHFSIPTKSTQLGPACTS